MIMIMLMTIMMKKRFGCARRKCWCVCVCRIGSMRWKSAQSFSQYLRISNFQKSHSFFHYHDDIVFRPFDVFSWKKWIIFLILWLPFWIWLEIRIKSICIKNIWHFRSRGINLIKAFTPSLCVCICIKSISYKQFQIFLITESISGFEFQ